jgi:hypothetical protein
MCSFGESESFAPYRRSHSFGHKLECEFRPRQKLFFESRNFNDFTDHEVRPWVRLGASRRRPRARCYTETEVPQKTNPMNSSVRLQESGRAGLCAVQKRIFRATMVHAPLVARHAHRSCRCGSRRIPLSSSQHPPILVFSEGRAPDFARTTSRNASPNRGLRDRCEREWTVI